MNAHNGRHAFRGHHKIAGSERDARPSRRVDHGKELRLHVKRQVTVSRRVAPAAKEATFGRGRPYCRLGLVGKVLNGRRGGRVEYDLSQRVRHREAPQLTVDAVPDGRRKEDHLDGAREMPREVLSRKPHFGGQEGTLDHGWTRDHVHALAQLFDAVGELGRNLLSPIAKIAQDLVAPRFAMP